MELCAGGKYKALMKHRLIKRGAICTVKGWYTDSNNVCWITIDVGEYVLSDKDFETIFVPGNKGGIGSSLIYVTHCYDMVEEALDAGYTFSYDAGETYGSLYCKNINGYGKEYVTISEPDNENWSDGSNPHRMTDWSSSYTRASYWKFDYVPICETRLKKSACIHDVYRQDEETGRIDVGVYLSYSDEPEDEEWLFWVNTETYPYLDHEHLHKECVRVVGQTAEKYHIAYKFSKGF